MTTPKLGGWNIHGIERKALSSDDAFVTVESDVFHDLTRVGKLDPLPSLLLPSNALT
jgi:hypothetical protein